MYCVFSGPKNHRALSTLPLSAAYATGSGSGSALLAFDRVRIYPRARGFVGWYWYACSPLVSLLSLPVQFALSPYSAHRVQEDAYSHVVLVTVLARRRFGHVRNSLACRRRCNLRRHREEISSMMWPPTTSTSCASVWDSVNQERLVMCPAECPQTFV